MGLLIHRMLETYNVDEAIETLPIPTDKRRRVETHLMMYAPTAYENPGIPVLSIWSKLPLDVQETLNEATRKEFTDLDEEEE